MRFNYWSKNVIFVLLSLAISVKQESNESEKALPSVLPNGCRNSTLLTRVNCSTLLVGQYICPDPSYNFIDITTQQPTGCTKDNRARVLCRAARCIICNETGNGTFWRDDFPCKWTNGYHFDTALLLSVFFGMFGADRFYLGYTAIGLLKFCTLGFLFLGQLVDVILIATQVVGPADGSYYVIPYYGPKTVFVKSDNLTYRYPQADWRLQARTEF